MRMGLCTLRGQRSPNVSITFFLVFLGLGRNEHCHSLSFELRHLLNTSDVLQVVGKAKQQNLALLFEEDGTSTEEDIGLNLRALFDEFLGVLELELIVVVVGLRTEANLLNDRLDLLGLDFLLLLFLLIEELLVVEDAAYWGIGVGRDFDQIEFLIISHFHGLLNGVDARVLNVITNEANFLHADSVVNPMLSLGLLRSTPLITSVAAIVVVCWATVVIGGVIHYVFLKLYFLVLALGHAQFPY